ncbi:MAG: 3-deoxy-8-phosphooctulonate synthase [Deltaproteobacteria bacterium]|nr:3-deoxy-8-phosphooctulonate synthase [Deltaproteobacteria bacterium]
MGAAREVAVGALRIGGGRPLVLIAGQCVIEGEGAALHTAGRLREVTARLGIPLIYKSSYDKANRSSLRSFRGPGLKEGLRVLQRVKEEMGLPVLSDVHAVEEIGPASEVLDVLQIPAFLCRQTDLVVAAARSGRPVNLKKGQFLAPEDMAHVVEKAAAQGNHQLLVTERGASYGYHNLVVDMRALVILRRLGYPVVFDATHSAQLPGALGTASGGEREFVPALARAAVAVGVDALFFEVHERPDEALSDAPNSLPLSWLPALLEELKALDALVKGRRGGSERW